MDAIELLRAASSHHDADALLPALHPDVEFRTPVSSRLVLRGPADVTTLLRTTFSLFDEMAPRLVLGDGTDRVLVVDCRFGRFRLTDALVVALADDGRIRRLEPHLRPWPSSSIFLVLVAMRLVRRPRLLRRSFGRPG